MIGSRSVSSDCLAKATVFCDVPTNVSRRSAVVSVLQLKPSVAHIYRSDAKLRMEMTSTFEDVIHPRQLQKFVLYLGLGQLKEKRKQTNLIKISKHPLRNRGLLYALEYNIALECT